MGSILTYLLNNIPWLAAIVITAIVFWKLSKYHAKLEDTQNKVNNLPCDSHKESLRDSEERYNRLFNSVQSTNDMVLEINKWIMKFDSSMIDKLAKKASPLKMTSLGTELFNISGAKEVIDDNKEFWIEEIRKTNPNTAYDVESESINVLFRNIGSPYFDKVKKFIYYSADPLEIKDPSSGEMKKVKVSIQSLIQLMGIHLRDLYLERYKLE